jgi:UDP-glucuronate decarboxylase
MPAACDDPRQRKPDIALATRLLGWTPRVGIDEGLARTIDYFRRTLVPATKLRAKSGALTSGDAARPR